MSEASPTDALMQRLREAGAARLDAVGWHYIKVLARRTDLQTGSAQPLLHKKLQQALQAFEQRMSALPTAAPTPPAEALPSPLALLLQEMAPPPHASHSTQALPATSPLARHRESPRVRQFRKQLRQISVQKQVSKAIAQAPQNAGPINSHMLVLRALGVMRDISPDYLQRFMTHLDTLLCLEQSEQNRLLARKPKKTAKDRS